MAHYLDTSALVKLVVAEPESTALLTWASEAERTPVSSDLARTELLRATRAAAPAATTQARDVLATVTLVSPSRATFDAAGLLEPPTLRSLDALHLATAMELGDDLEAVVTYDRRMADACTSLGLTVLAPGR